MYTTVYTLLYIQSHKISYLVKYSKYHKKKKNNKQIAVAMLLTQSVA